MFERFNPFAKNEAAPEPQEKTGGVVHEISTEQEAPQQSEAERYESIKAGIEAIVEEMGIPSNDIMGRDSMYMDRLVEKGVLTASQARFPGAAEDVKRAAKEVAREHVTAEDTQRNTLGINRQKNWKIK